MILSLWKYHKKLKITIQIWKKNSATAGFLASFACFFLWYIQLFYVNLRLDWHDQVNHIAVKLNRANVLLLKIRNYIKMKKNIYIEIFDSHLTYSCTVWAQNINTVNRLIILQNEAQQIVNFKDQLSSSPLVSENNVLKFGDKITLENMLFVKKAINRQLPPIFYDWFTFLGNLNRY